MTDENTIRMRAISTTVPEDIYLALTAEADAEDRKLAAHVRRILRAHVDHLRRPAAYQPEPWQPAAPITTPNPPRDPNIYTAPHDPTVEVRWSEPAGTSNDEGLS